jgi:hypothetical protein
MAKAKERNQVAVTLNPELREVLAIAAKEERRTISNLARVIIEQALESRVSAGRIAA